MLDAGNYHDILHELMAAQLPIKQSITSKTLFTYLFYFHATVSHARP